MKITKKVTTVEEVELSLPAYFKREFTMFKITSEKSGLDVSIWGENAAMIKKMRYEHEVEEAISLTPATEHEFNNFLANALDLAANLADEIAPKMQAEHSHLFINEQKFLNI